MKGEKGASLLTIARQYFPLRPPIRTEDRRRKEDKYQEDLRRFLEEKKRDEISHYILRLAFCDSLDHQRYLLSHECELFRLRFNSLSADQVDIFLQNSRLNDKYEKVTDEEYKRLEGQLKTMEKLGRKRKDKSDGGANTSAAVSDGTYYKVPFEDVIELVRTRSVLIRGGVVYVPREHLDSLLQTTFREALQSALEVAGQLITRLNEEESDRLVPLLNEIAAASSFNMGGQNSGTSFTGAMDGLSLRLEDLDMVAPTAFPPCMSYMYRNLKEYHHLRHMGRVQFGLFLKGAGLTLDESLSFWSSHFAGKGIDKAKFDRAYSYNIRHHYGQEGKRADYPPLGCKNIIFSSVGAGEYHGCPFKHFDGDHLQAFLASIPGGSDPQINHASVTLAQQGHYGLACSQILHARFPTVEPASLAFDAHPHPNAFLTDALAAMQLGQQQQQQQQSVPKQP